MNILQFAYGLEFDDNFSFDQEIQPMFANLVIAQSAGGVPSLAAFGMIAMRRK